MPRYRFSGGKIWIEEGIYDPAIERVRRKDRGQVLVTLPLAGRLLRKDKQETETTHHAEPQ